MSQPEGTAEDRRSGPDVASLLVELGRLLRACRYYPIGHETLSESFRRTLQAFQGEIDRHGALDLELEGSSFPCAGGSLAPEILDEVARELLARGLRAVRLEPPLDAEAFAAFVQVMVMEPAALERAGGTVRALGRRIVGGIELRPQSPHPPAEPALDRQRPPGAESVELGFAAEETPFGALLAEFEECEENSGYARLADRILTAAQQAAGSGRAEEALRAVRVVSAHASGEAKRNAHHLEVALTTLRRLLEGPILADLLDRACSDDSGASVEATRILVQSGERLVPALLDELDRCEDSERRERLRSVLLALGEDAAQPLLEWIGSADRRRARNAVRLCGELQHPRAVEWLEDLVAASDPLLRKEAVLALARITGPASLQAVLRALDSPERDVQVLAVQALGSSGRPRAVAPLAERLQRDVEAGDLERAREAIRALGRLGRAEGAPALARILERRKLFGRSKLRELKLAAVAALGNLPGDLAQASLQRVVGEGDAGLRRAAQTALRRSQTATAAQPDGPG
ncbi:MAG: HEAT repeat domain-containing protein [Myxococcota bacterium]